MKTPFDHHRDLNCICFGSRVECVCPDGEMALRHYAYGTKDSGHRMPPMTVEQRHWCLDEIGEVEGFEPADFHGLPDADLARGVLQAWLEFCRDKGLAR